MNRGVQVELNWNTEATIPPVHRWELYVYLEDTAAHATVFDVPDSSGTYLK